MSTRTTHFGQTHEPAARGLTRLLRAARQHRRALALGLGIVVAGCGAAPTVGNYSLAVLEKTAQFRNIAMSTAWVAPAGRIIALDRNLGSEFEQKIALTNNTTLPGDNFMWLRARVPSGYPAGSFRLVDFLGRVGQVPTPFTRVSDENLNYGDDTLGRYFYLTNQASGDTNCVLAFRRIDNAGRLLPRNTSILEVLIRNCVRGSVEEALRPITDAQIGVSAVAGIGPVEGGNRMLSPLAAPLLNE
ncbi:hypothetical protein [Pseudoroseicyclus sp. CXY001]|uniref:hypothetical protein n=1 Tax=Pseudoroseicyclus sp. CXY001 TaxID=3242492 RepID=UPI0035712C2F